MGAYEDILMELKPLNETPEPKPDWDKPSLAVIASVNGDGVVLHYAGPHIEYEIDSVGHKLEDLGLDDAPDGISIWEGKVVSHRYDSPEYGTDYDTELVGEFREPTVEEWEAIKRNECPWDPLNWYRPEDHHLLVPDPTAEPF